MFIRILILGIATASKMVWASELTYQPINPNFGGHPSNGAMLMSNAQAQNDKKDPDRKSLGREEESSLERLTSRLESRLLNDLLSDAAEGKTGTLLTDDLEVEVTDEGDGAVRIQVRDRVTGDTSVIEIGANLSSF